MTESSRHRLGASGLAGALCMMFAQVFTQPGDVLKTIVGTLSLLCEGNLRMLLIFYLSARRERIHDCYAEGRCREWIHGVKFSISLSTVIFLGQSFEK
jgi:hypothetical protein